MIKEKMITRTIVQTTAQVMGIDVTKEEILLGMTESQFFKYATVVITDKERR